MRKGFFALGAALAVLTPTAVGAEPPVPADGTFELPAGAACTFPVTLDVTGKTKFIDLGDRTIVTAPGQRVVVTNTNDPDRHVEFVITGSYHITTLPDGTQEYVLTGRNLVSEAVGQGAGGGFLDLVSGRFTFTIDPDPFTVIATLAGKGPRTDVCALIASP